MNINVMNMTLSWLSIFLMLWNWSYEILPINVKTVSIFVLFCIVAFLSGTSEMTRRKENGKEKNED